MPPPIRLKSDLIDKKVQQLKNLLIGIPSVDLPEIFIKAGCKEVLKEIGINLPDDADIDDVDSYEAVDRMLYKTIAAGMDTRNPNAQMVAQFLKIKEQREGEKQLEGIEIHVVPATIPDHMTEEVAQIMRELTDIATSN
jgi:hypothetical protein